MNIFRIIEFSIVESSNVLKLDRVTLAQETSFVLQSNCVSFNYLGL